jgi:hypothetical protein
MVGRAIKIVAATRNVNHLTELVKEKRAVALQHCDAGDLFVYYPPGTPLDALNDNARLRPGGPVPGGTTDEQPLMVMAPPVTQQGKCL